VVRFDGVGFAYGPTSVLEGVSFTVDRGDILCIVGPNGGGKTTILKLMLGLLEPLEGAVEVFGGPPLRARPRIGYMPQRTVFDPLFPVTVMDVVLMGRLQVSGFRVFNSRADRDAALEALDMVEVRGLAKRPFQSLSSGQSQRVLLARALVSRPELLVLDEPTSSVDAAAGTGFYALLRRLNDFMTIIIVTHDLGFVSQDLKKVACVNRTLAMHPTCEISQETLNELYGRDVHMVRHDTLVGKG
jgi:zinc transport system ATP-binding protein